MIGELLALLGAILVLISAIGVVRLPDVLARLHALSKASTVGVLLLFGGAAANLDDLNALTSVVLAGHSNTERGFLKVLQRRLREPFAGELDVRLARSDSDPFRVV